MKANLPNPSVKNDQQSSQAALALRELRRLVRELFYQPMPATAIAAPDYSAATAVAPALGGVGSGLSLPTPARPTAAPAAPAEVPKTPWEILATERRVEARLWTVLAVASASVLATSVVWAFWS